MTQWSCQHTVHLKKGIFYEYVLLYFPIEVIFPRLGQVHVLKGIHCSEGLSSTNRWLGRTREHYVTGYAD